MIYRAILPRRLLEIFLISLILVNTGHAFSGSIKIYYYSAENCPHCMAFGPLIYKMVERHSEVELVEKDIWQNREALNEMVSLLETHGDFPVAAPTLFLGDRFWIGVDDLTISEIEDELMRCYETVCPDAINRLIEHQKQQPETSLVEHQTIELPLLGNQDASKVSLPVVTIVLGLLDSLNPCAFFVLLFLLTLMVHAHSRLRMLTVGVVFVFFSGFIYFLFMAAWLNLFLVTGGLHLVTFLAGLIAVVIGLLNIKDYFYLHRGPSLSIPEKVKPNLYHRVRDLVQSANYAALLGGTVMLAIAANSYELLCTAGFPMVFTRILTFQSLPNWQYYAYLIAYNIVYIIPLMIIVVVFAMTMGAHQLSETLGRFLKLLSGAMMLAMGFVLLFFPTFLQSFLGVVMVFLSAALLLVFIILTARFMPKTS